MIGWLALAALLGGDETLSLETLPPLAAIPASPGTPAAAEPPCPHCGQRVLPRSPNVRKDSIYRRIPAAEALPPFEFPTGIALVPVPHEPATAVVATPALASLAAPVAMAPQVAPAAARGFVPRYEEWTPPHLAAPRAAAPVVAVRTAPAARQAAPLVAIRTAPAARPSAPRVEPSVRNVPAVAASSVAGPQFRRETAPPPAPQYVAAKPMSGTAPPPAVAVAVATELIPLPVSKVAAWSAPARSGESMAIPADAWVARPLAGPAPAPATAVNATRPVVRGTLHRTEQGAGGWLIRTPEGIAYRVKADPQQPLADRSMVEIVGAIVPPPPREALPTLVAERVSVQVR